MLYAAMGTGCASVSRTSSSESDVCVGAWAETQDGRARHGTYRDLAEYGGSVETVDGTRHPLGSGLTPESCTAAMLSDVVRWFRGDVAPSVPTQEILESCAFIAAAEESKARHGESLSANPIFI
jgi:hypothetical protein